MEEFIEKFGSLIKSSEGAIVIVGCLLTLFFGKGLAIFVLIGYVLINIPNLIKFISDWLFQKPPQE